MEVNEERERLRKKIRPYFLRWEETIASMGIKGLFGRAPAPLKTAPALPPLVERLF
jgi:hypothetical protein